MKRLLPAQREFLITAAFQIGKASCLKPGFGDIATSYMMTLSRVMELGGYEENDEPTLKSIREWYIDYTKPRKVQKFDTPEEARIAGQPDIQNKFKEILKDVDLLPKIDNNPYGLAEQLKITDDVYNDLIQGIIDETGW